MNRDQILKKDSSDACNVSYEGSWKIRSFPPPTRNRGIVLFLVLAVLFVVGMLFFYQATNTMQFRGATHHVLEDDVAIQVARSCAAVYWAFLQKCIKKHSGCSLYPSGISRLLAGSSFNMDISEFKDQIPINAALKEICNLFPSAGLTPNNISMTSAWEIWRKNIARGGNYSTCSIGQIELSVEFKLNRRNYNFTFPCDLKVIQILPYVVSKFTLYVKEPPDADEHCYNTILKKYDNAMQKKSLTLFNNQTSMDTLSDKTAVWKNSGWIYLGNPSGKKIVINLDGTQPQLPDSEHFIFWPNFLSQTDSKPMAAISDPLPHPAWRVHMTPRGATEEWHTNEEYKKKIGDSDICEKLAMSSAIHLYGNSDLMTPTRVVGNVTANFVLLAKLQNMPGYPADPSVKNLSFGGINYPVIFFLDRHFPVDFPTIDLYLHGNPLYTYISWGEPMLGFPSFNTLFSTMDAYRTHMTKVFAYDFMEPENSFNRIYDIMFEGLRNTPPPRLFPPRGNALPSAFYESNDYKTFKLPDDTGEQFSGDLTSFDFGETYSSEDYYSHKYPNASKFLDQLLGSGSKKLINHPLVVYIDDALVLPEIESECAGVIVARDKITIEKNIGMTQSAVLTIVSKEGDIEVKPGVEMHGVSLLSPKGEIRWGSGARLWGTLAAKKVNLSDLGTRGGEIHYDPRMDPTNAAMLEKGLTVMVGARDSNPLKK